MNDTWLIMEVDGDCLHPSVVSVSGIIHISFKDLKEKQDIWIFLLTCDSKQGRCCQLLTWNPDDLNSLVMRSRIFALSDGETANEFNASSENSRCSVRETCSPGSTIPYDTRTRTNKVTETSDIPETLFFKTRVFLTANIFDANHHIMVSTRAQNNILLCWYYLYQRICSPICAIVKLFLRPEKNAWTSDLKWCHYVVCPLFED